MMSESRRKKRYFVLPMVILLAAGMTWSTPAVRGAAAAAGRAQSDRVDGFAVAAHAWVTTADGQLEFSDQGTVPFATAKPDQLTISVDPSRTFQTMQGFGASLTDSSAAVLYRLDRPARDAAMVQLFDPQRGDGLSYLRQVIGSSDFVATSSHYTYDDLPAVGTDYEMRLFSIAHDQIQICCP